MRKMAARCLWLRHLAHSLRPQYRRLQHGHQTYVRHSHVVQRHDVGGAVIAQCNDVSATLHCAKASHRYAGQHSLPARQDVSHDLAWSDRRTGSRRPKSEAISRVNALNAAQTPRSASAPWTRLPAMEVTLTISHWPFQED